MAKFFIDRPIFAWVIAIFIILIGAVSYTQLPVEQYPSVAPPTISIQARYPGASAHMLDEAVLSVIERQMNGSPGLAYIESTSASTGAGSIVLHFEPGTNADLAQVDVQNRLATVTSRLPEMVIKQGVQVEKASSAFLLFVAFVSTRDGYTVDELSDYVARNIVPELQRVKGVGKVELYSAERAMRIWVDPAKLTGYNISMEQVVAAISAQNAPIPAGTLGGLPSPDSQTIFATLDVNGQLSTAEQFGNIVLRANTDGSALRLKDVAKINIGAEGYNFSGWLNGQRTVSVGVQLTNGGNAVEVSKAIEARMKELQVFLPEGVQWHVPYNSSKFVNISMKQVAHTLVEAIVLVFLVMLLFLQNWRYTVIPTIVVPVALLGTLGVLLATGFSLNVLTMFGMVLVIGIVVDDAIIVVENVERLMTEEGLTPVQAAKKAMGQISGAIVGVTLVLIAVFIPLAFFKGSIGTIYRQFAVTMTASIAFSAFLALTLTPALCATLLKPVERGHGEKAKKGFLGWFNRNFSRTAKKYEGAVAKLLKRGWTLMIVYVVIGLAAAWIYNRLPTSFLPNEDQGFLINNVQLPPNASQHRVLQAIQGSEQFFRQQPEVKDVITILGFSFSGMGQNAALQFITLKDWSERKGKEHSAQALANRAMQHLVQYRDAFMFTLSPPPIPGLGSASGFEMRLEDRASLGHDALLTGRNQLLGMARQSKILKDVRPDGLEDAPQLKLEIDRDKINAMGINLNTIRSVLGVALGSSYINDFPNEGRMQRVIIQGDVKARMTPEQILELTVLSSSGQTVPLSSFVTAHWQKGPAQTVRYNGYPSMKITGEAAPGYSTGESMLEMERLVSQLPKGFGLEWTGQSREEKLAGSMGLILYFFSIVAVFLCLAALYESWSIPFAVILVVPLGLFGVFCFTWWHSLSKDIYFQIGLVTIIGLSAKNAILIIEFAKDLQAQGLSVMHAALQAAHIRFRPIIMTSLAFTCGVLPLYFATGAGSASQRAIGTGVLGGMITGTVLILLFVPIFFVLVRSIFKYKPKPHETPEGGALVAPTLKDKSDD